MFILKQADYYLKDIFKINELIYDELIKEPITARLFTIF